MFKTLKDFNFENKKVLVRCDFDVPMDNESRILDDYRIEQSLPTIRYLLENNAKVILMGHAGRPDGKVVESLRLNPIQEKIKGYLNVPTFKADDCIGPEVKKMAEELKPGEILILENLRFHNEETDNDENFAKQLSLLCDIYVNESFAVDHRAHASLVGVPKFVPSCAGFLLAKEVKNLSKILENPAHPMTAIVGGKKVETKAEFIDKISETADFVIVSGLIEKEIQDTNMKLKFPEKILAPAKNLADKDIDQETADLFINTILKSKTIIWNGPVGKIEDENYRKGTMEIAQAIIDSKAFSVVGGGETVEFIKSENLMDKFSHVSTGGGAMLAYLSGEKLPGIVALENSK